MAVGDLIEQIVIETRFFPPIVIDRPLDNQPGPPNPLLSLLRPKITISTPLSAPIVAHPWGDVGRNYWPEVQAGLVGLAVVAVGVVVFIKK